LRADLEPDGSRAAALGGHVAAEDRGRVGVAGYDGGGGQRGRVVVIPSPPTISANAKLLTRAFWKNPS
jgi:hypothetical protein